jgi:hypothetical protein
MRTYLLAAVAAAFTAINLLAAEPAAPVKLPVRPVKSQKAVKPAVPLAQPNVANSRLRTIATDLKKHYDANNNGVLEKNELEALQKDMETAERLAHTHRIYKNVISKLDADNDLNLSDAELAKLPELQKETIRQMKERRDARKADKKQ